MLNLKKTAVAVLALGSSAVFAGSMGPVCAPGNVTIPCERTAWNVGAQALYLQPVYAAEGVSPRVNGGSNALNPGTGLVGSYNETLNSPSWGWGFMIEGSYHYGMGNDVNVNWYHLNNASSQTAPSLVDPSQFGGTNVADNQVSQWENASFSLHPEWDAVNVEFGQHVDFGDMKNIRLHGGVEYARVATGLSVQSRPTQLGNDYHETNSSTFNGFGPRGGVDMSYDVGNGFSVYGNGAGGIYVGTGSYNSTATLPVTGAGLPPGVTTSIKSVSGSNTLLVPELEAKLGLKYNYNLAAMGMMPQGDLVLDVGWMWVNYFNAQQSGNAGVFNTSGTRRVNASQADFGVQGLNFGLKWIGSV